MPVRKSVDRVQGHDPSLNWLYKCTGARLRIFTSHRAVPSLMNLAARALVRNLHRIEPSQIDDLPDHILKEIWNAMKRSGLVSLRAIQFFGPYADTKLYQEYRLRIASGDTETKKGKAAVINSNYQLALKYLANTNSPDRRWMVTVHSVGLLPWSSIIQLGLMENLKMLWLSAEFADLKSKQQLKEYLREGICFPSLQCLILDCDILSMDMVLLFAALPTVQLLCLAREEDEPCFEQSRGVGESRASLSRIMLQDWRPCRGKRFDNYVWTDRKAVIEKLGRKLCNGHDKRPEILLSVGPPMRKTSWKWDHKKQDIFYQVYEKRELVV